MWSCSKGQTEPCMLQACLPRLALGSSDSPGKGATCPRDDTPGRLLQLFLPAPLFPPSTSHLGCVTGDLGLQRASHAPWGLALPVFSFPCLPGGFLSFSSPTKGRGGNADGEAWGQRDLAVLCPGSPAAQYRAVGGLEKGHHLQVNADRAFAEIKCCLLPVDLPPLRVQDSMGRGLIEFHSDLSLH